MSRHPSSQKTIWPRDSFIVALVRHFIHTPENFLLLGEKLPGLLARHASFEMEFHNLHLSFSNTVVPSVKYFLKSASLAKLRHDVEQTLADGLVRMRDGKSVDTKPATVTLHEYFTTFQRRVPAI